MANRLKIFMGSIISEEQSGFLLGRSIFEGVVVAHEAGHSVRSSKSQNMMVKLDIKRAYDEVDRGFLICVLRKFGFEQEWLQWVESCLFTLRFSVLVNGSPQGFFEQEKGIRQGDPLSPFLFIIMAEVLGRLILKQKALGLWKGIRITKQ